MADAQLKQVLGLLEASLSDSAPQRVQAADALAQLASQPGFAVLMLQAVSLPSINATVRLNGAIQLKNFVKANWQGDENRVPIPPAERASIKQMLLQLVLTAEPSCQKQLAAAATLVAQRDFPADWPELLPTLVPNMTCGDWELTLKTLGVLHPVFKRFRGSQGGRMVVEELKLVLKAVQEPLLSMFQGALVALAQATQDGNAVMLRCLMSVLLLACKMFYSLCDVDLPAYFEDHLDEWMTGFHQLLQYDNPLLASNDDDVPSPLDHLHAAIVQNLTMYMERYDDETNKYASSVMQDVWQMLQRCTMASRFDPLVVGCLEFLATISKGVHHTAFADEGTLSVICEKVAVPNMYLTERDELQFDEEPAVYALADLQGGDHLTRRKSAHTLIKALLVRFEAQVSALCTGYLQQMLAGYAANPKGAWQMKDVAEYLFVALAARTDSTTASGVTHTSEKLNVQQFFDEHIFPDLAADSSTADALHPILQADALRYIHTFRTLLSSESLRRAMPQIVRLMRHPRYVVHSYAAVCWDELLRPVRDPATHRRVLRFTAVDVNQYLEEVFAALFDALSITESIENHYVMRAILRTIQVADTAIVPLIPQYFSRMVGILDQVCRNSSVADFRHYLFEAISLLVNIVTQTDAKSVDRFEALLFEPFNVILQQGMSEFTGYVFQILALLLERRPPPVSGNYRALFAPLLTAQLWEVPGNVPGLVRLICAYIVKAPDVVAPSIEPLLGVFQRQLAAKDTDQNAFYLLNGVIEHIQPAVWVSHLRQVMLLCLTKLQNPQLRTAKFTRAFLLFVCLLVGKHGAEDATSALEAVQAGMAAQFLQHVLLPNMAKVTDAVERKMVAVALVKLLTDAPSVAASPELWRALLRGLISFFVNGIDTSTDAAEEDALLEIEDTPGYQPAFSQLAFAKTETADPFPEVTEDMRLVTVRALAQLAAANAATWTSLVQGALQEDERTVLQTFAGQAGVALPV